MPFGRQVQSTLAVGSRGTEFCQHRASPYDAEVDECATHLTVQRGGEIIDEGLGRSIDGDTLAGQAARNRKVSCTTAATFTLNISIAVFQGISAPKPYQPNPALFTRTSTCP